jgi:hypothetical protein
MSKKYLESCRKVELLQLLHKSHEIIQELCLNEHKDVIKKLIEDITLKKDYYCKGAPFTGREDYIRLFFTYNPETGEIRRKDKKKSCGSYDGFGYLKIKIKGRSFMAHRVAWFLYYGKAPEMELDHINGDRADNRICNLREVTRAENNYNRSHRVNQTTGYVGISPKRYKTHTLYKVHYRNRNYYFDTIEEAVNFRKEKGLKI